MPPRNGFLEPTHDFRRRRHSVFGKHVEQLYGDLAMDVAMPHRLRQRARICQTDRRLACAQRQEIALDAQALLPRGGNATLGVRRRGRRCTSRCLRRLELTGPRVEASFSTTAFTSSCKQSAI